MTKYIIHKLIEDISDIGPMFDEIKIDAFSDHDAVNKYKAHQFDKPFKGFLMREPEKLIEDDNNGHWEKDNND